MITIVDYGLGNLKSIQNMLKKLDIDSSITNNIEQISEAKKIILPGVGSFDTAIRNLKDLGLIDILNYKALDEKIPFLGICLGMQIMCNKSEEGILEGLSWIDAEVKRFKFKNKKHKLPHMGWNKVFLSKKSPIFNMNESSNMRFYHVHSYYVKLKDLNLEIARTKYEFSFTTSFQKDNIFGVQFHPEKSHKFGFNLFQQFGKL